MHLAVVFDPTAKEVRHYANGSLLAKIALWDRVLSEVEIKAMGR